MKNYLFVCQHNFTRSKYGAEFFRGYLKGKKKQGKVYSAGLGGISIFVGRKVNKKLLKKMDWVFVMEKYMKDYLVRKFGLDKNKIVVLNIEDNYGFLRRKTVDDLDTVFEKIDWKKFLYVR